MSLQTLQYDANREIKPLEWSPSGIIDSQRSTLLPKFENALQKGLESGGISPEILQKIRTQIMSMMEVLQSNGNGLGGFDTGSIIEGFDTILGQAHLGQCVRSWNMSTEIAEREFEKSEADIDLEKWEAALEISEIVKAAKEVILEVCFDLYHGDFPATKWRMAKTKIHSSLNQLLRFIDGLK